MINNKKRKGKIGIVNFELFKKKIRKPSGGGIDVRAKSTETLLLLFFPQRRRRRLAYSFEGI
jgi:hypothetical protein